MAWARTQTVTQYIADARARADREADDPTNGFVPDREVIRYIQKAGQKLWSMLVEAYGTDYFWTQYNFILPAGAVNGIGSYVTVPPDFFKLRGISYKLNNGLAVPLKPFTMFEREKYRSNPVLVWWGVEYRYHLEGTQIHFIPSAQGNITMVMFYTPICPFLGYGGVAALSIASTAVTSGVSGALAVNVPSHKLRTGQAIRWTLGASGSPALPTGLRADTDYYVVVIDGDNFNLAIDQANAMGQGDVTPTLIAFAGAGSGTNTVDCVFDGINGFDEFIVLDAAINILRKEESDVTTLLMERGKIESDLRMMAEDRDAAFPGQVQDTQSLYWQINPTGRAY